MYGRLNSRQSEHLARLSITRSTMMRRKYLENRDFPRCSIHDLTEALEWHLHRPTHASESSAAEPDHRSRRSAGFITTGGRRKTRRRPKKKPDRQYPADLYRC